MQLVGEDQQQVVQQVRCPVMLLPAANDKPEVKEQGLDPHVPLDQILHGEPDAGAHWDEYRFRRMEEQGWKRVATIASSSIFHRNRVFLAVYVDDGAAIGPLKAMLGALWQLSDVLSMKDIERLHHMLGIRFATLHYRGTRMMLPPQLQCQEMLLKRVQEDCPQPLREAQVPYILVDPALEE